MNENNNFGQITEQKKSNNWLKIIGIVVLIVAIIIFVFVFISSSSKSSNNDQSNGDINGTTKNGIKQLIVEDGEVTAIDNNNDMYVAFSKSDSDKSYQYYGLEKKPIYPIKVASNVKKAYSVFSYLDMNGDYYNTYYRLGGGVHKSFEKIYSGVKDTAQMLNLCILLVDTSNQLFVRGTYGYCGINNSSDYSLFASDIKTVYNSSYVGFYITTNDELYMITYNTAVKIMDNVRNITSSSWNNYYVNTTDNKLYEIITVEESMPYNQFKYNVSETKLVADNVVELTENSYKLSDGSVYFKTDNFCKLRDVSGVVSCAEGDIFAKTSLTDIDIVYTSLSSYVHNSLVYKTTDGKIKMIKVEENDHVSSIIEKKVLDYSIESIDEIAEFYD